MIDMKKFFLILTVLGCALQMGAKEYISIDGGHNLRGFGEEKYNLSLMAEYGYNRTWEHMANVDIFAHMPVVKQEPRECDHVHACERMQ